MKKYITLILFSILCISCLSGCNKDDSHKSLQQARQDVFDYFSEYQNALEESKDLILKNHSSDGVSIEKINQIKYYNHIASNFNKEINTIVFECGNWSMLMYWGQDWGIYYNDQDVPLNTLYTDKILEETDGMFYFWVNQNLGEKRRYCVSERITKNWFFYYNNWEGKPSLLCAMIE